METCNSIEGFVEGFTNNVSTLPNYSNDFHFVKFTPFFNQYLQSLVPVMYCTDERQCSKCFFYVFDENFTLYKVDKVGYSEQQCRDLLQFIRTAKKIQVGKKSTGEIIYPHKTISTTITKYIIILTLLVLLVLYVIM